MNEHFLRLDYKEIPILKQELKGVRWRVKPLLEPVSPVEYNLVMYSQTRNEYHCAEGIIWAMLGIRKNKKEAQV